MNVNEFDSCARRIAKLVKFDNVLLMSLARSEILWPTLLYISST